MDSATRKNTLNLFAVIILFVLFVYDSTETTDSRVKKQITRRTQITVMDKMPVQKRVRVAIIDTGSNARHNKNETNYDFNGHGTHIHGIVKSLAPSANIDIIRYHKFKRGSRSPASLTTKKSNLALRRAIESNVKVINYSSAGGKYNAEEEALLKMANRKGIIVVVAAGNDSKDIDLNKNYPSSYKLPNIISVMNVSAIGMPHRTTNFGKRTVFIAAQGNGIPSYNRDATGSTFKSGTSQATAVVSATISNMLAVNPRLSVRDIRRILMNTVKHQHYLNNKNYSQGIIDSNKAIKMALKEYKKIKKLNQKQNRL